MPLLQTLQHKASKSRLRRLSNKSQDATATVVPPVPSLPRTAASGNAGSSPSGRTDVFYDDDDTSTRPPEVLSPDMSTNSPNPSNSLKFWRKRAPSPSPELTQSPFMPSLDRQKSTKSILRRRPSSRSESEDERETAPRVTFGNGARSRPGVTSYQPPPSAYGGHQRRPDSAASSHGVPTPPMPCPSPSLSVNGSVNGRSPGHRTSSLPPSPAFGASSSPNSGSYFPHGTPQTPGSVGLSPVGLLPSTPMSQASRASSANSHSSHTSSGGSSTPASTSGASSRLSTVSTSSTSTVSPGRNFPGAVPESPADAACRPYTPSGSTSRASSRTLTYRSSRPQSTAGSSVASTIRAPAQQQQQQSRPGSAMSNTSSSRRRVSSRPATRSSRSTRASIASISTFTSSSSHGHGAGSLTSPGGISPGGISPISPMNSHTGFFGYSPGSNGHGYPSYSASSSSHGHSPVSAQAFTFPPTQNSGRSSTTPTPSTPPQHTRFLPPGLGRVTDISEEVPLFNVIPATPGAAEEDAVVEPQQQVHRRSSSSGRPRSSSMERTLEVMHEEDEEAENEVDDREPVAARKLNFDMDEFDEPSPKLNDSAQLGGSHGSPIRLNTLSIDDVDSDGESDETEVRTTEEPAQSTNEVFKMDDSFSLAIQSVPAPPPRFPKSPARLTKSLYQAHDDGRSISQSLAELAAIACDLPPLGEDMAMNANVAAQRLAEARANVDTSEPAFDFSSPRPLSAAPIMMGNYQGNHRPPVKKASSMSPPNRATMSFSGEERKPMTAPPPRCPLPPTPPSSSSYSSLPSLVSHGSMPSSSSGCTTSSWNSQNSITSSPESEHNIDMLFGNLSIDSHHADLPDNPGLGLGLGLGLEASFMEKSEPKQPTIAVSPADDDDIPDEVRVRPHRMSAMSAHPHRVALYGTPTLGGIRERDSYCSVASTIRHTPSGSISSLSMMSEFSDDEALNAQVVDITTFAHRIVGRQDARAHEVGVAF